MKTDHILNCSKLSIGYKPRVIAADLSFNLSAGELLVIKGSNGSGKSTLIKTILNELEPLTGSFNWNIEPSEIAYLPQVSYSQQNFSYTVNEILGLYDLKPWLLEEVPEALKQKKWIELSGGERQRVLFITRIDEQKKIAILDEPFNHLDKNSVKLLSKLINQALARNIAVILVSHQKPDSLSVASLEVSLA